MFANTVLLIAGAAMALFGGVSWRECAELWHYVVCAACIILGVAFMCVGVMSVPW